MENYEGVNAWIQTYTGKTYHFINPHIDEICIEDIAHALSQLCRFGGHVKNFYSVGQHSILCSLVVDAADAFTALMHDATEAYVVDMPRPIKSYLLNYDQLESTAWKAICRKFGMSFQLPAAIKTADTRMLMTEQRDLLGPQSRPWCTNDFEPYSFIIEPLPSQKVEEMFLERFYELEKQCSIKAKTL